MEKLKDLEDRLDQFIELNIRALDLGTLEGDERFLLVGQNMAFATVKVLIKQLRKNGSIWKGGYDDGTGTVVYGDQVENILQEMRANTIMFDMDEELRVRIDDQEI